MAEQSYSKNWFTPKNLLLYVIIGGIVYALIYFLFFANKGASPYTAPTSTTPAQTETGSVMNIILDGQNDSGQSGRVTLIEADGKTTVVIEASNPPLDVPQPAHIHAGACPTPGDVLYPLTDVVNGISETILEVDLATLRSQLPLAINVHKSAPEAKTYVACGNLN